MAQKLILCEAAVNGDVLASAPIATALAAGYVVTSASGYVTRDNRHMALVLLTEPAAETTTETTPSEETPAAAGSDTTTTTTTEETQGSEGGEGGNDENSGTPE